MIYNRKQRLHSVKKRIRGKRKWGLHLFFIFFIILLFFIFSKNIIVDEKTGGIAIVKTTEKKEFIDIYTGSVVSGDVLDIDIDLENVYLTGGLVDIIFSNNNEFNSLPTGLSSNNYKVKFGYMLGKSRNKNKVFWIGRVTDSLKKFNHNLIDDYEGGNLSFRAANLEGGELYVKIIVKGEKFIKED